MTKNFNTRLNRLSKLIGFKDELPQSESDKIIAAYLRTLSDEELEAMIVSKEEYYIPETFLENYKNV